MMDVSGLPLTGSPGTDSLVVLGIIACLVVLLLVINWARNRYITVELNGDTGVSADDPVMTYLPGVPGNPTMVTFLELEFPGRIESVMVVHRVGANVTFTDGTMQLFMRNGKPFGERFNPDQNRTERQGRASI